MEGPILLATHVEPGERGRAEDEAFELSRQLGLPVTALYVVHENWAKVIGADWLTSRTRPGGRSSATRNQNSRRETPSWTPRPRRARGGHRGPAPNQDRRAGPGDWRRGPRG